MPQNTFYYKSILVHVMVWRQQAIMWDNVDRNLLSYGVTMPQWVIAPRLPIIWASLLYKGVYMDSTDTNLANKVKLFVLCPPWSLSPVLWPQSPIGGAEPYLKIAIAKWQYLKHFQGGGLHLIWGACVYRQFLSYSGTCLMRPEKSY